MKASSKPSTTSTKVLHGHIQGTPPLTQDSSWDDLADSSSLNPSSKQWDINSALDRSLPNADNWSTSLQTVLDQPPSTLPCKLILGGMIFCLAFGAWVWLGQIEQVGHAQGRLVPKGHVYKIDSVESGKVAKITVEEGEAVKAGQVLVELDTQLVASEVERLQQMLAADQIQLNQMQALIDRTRLEAKTRAAIAESNSQAAVAAIAQVRAHATSAGELLTQLRADVAASLVRLARLKPLVEEGTIIWEHLFEAEQTLRDRQRTITQTQSKLQQALVEVNGVQARLNQKQAKGNTAQLAAQERQQLELEITKIKAKISETKNMLNSAKARLAQRFLYAPVDGFVSSLNIHNIGEVVRPGQTIGEVSPHNAPLVLFASLPNQEAGFVKTGMPVHVKLDAYPYQNYGTVTGKVTFISPDAKPDKRLGTVYQVEVALDRNYVNAKHKNIEFKAGHTATADIIICRRRIADILLNPPKEMQKSGTDL